MDIKNGLIIDEYGNQHWYKNDLLHREDGPAAISVYKDKAWYFNGKHHRLDGPALDFDNGSKHWFYHGKYIKCDSQEEFEKLIRLKAFW